MDQARIMDFIRNLLTALGALFAGSGIAEYFTDSNINVAVTLLGSLVMLGSTWWGNRSNTPVALAQKLVANPLINNSQAASAIAAGVPERVVVMPTPQTETTTGAKKR